jgi:hypothetical protein
VLRRKTVPAEVSVGEATMENLVFLGRGGETSLIGVQNSYMPVHTNDSKYKICSSWRDNPDEIITFLLFQNVGMGVPKNLHD